MDTQRPQKTETRVGEESQPSKPSQPAAPPASPPSASSSPSHEFSFTISLHSSSSDKAKTPPSFAIDLSPADDIFFHGHLLPLHLLSHLPVSPRSSTNSLDSFTLPIRDLMSDKEASNSSSTEKNSNSESKHHENNCDKTRRRTKSRPFSWFRLAKWRRETELELELELEQDEKENFKRKLKFDVSNLLKRYARMVRPLLFFAGRKENMQLRQPFSFSGNLDFKSKQDLRGRRPEVSAPASIRTSPSNSGLLVATAAHPSSTSDSTMEELQAAIQAAIAHCKNSNSKEEKIKC